MLYVLLYECGDGYTYWCNDIFCGFFDEKVLAEQERDRLLKTDEYSEDEHCGFHIQEVTINQPFLGTES